MKTSYTEHSDFLPYYIQQNEMKDKVIKEDILPDELRYIGGVDVAYYEKEKRMIGAIVVLDFQTLELVEEAFHEMDITFPYVPGLFSFREIPAIIEAFKKLNIRPDLIICDGHGIAHPKNVGMATHLGIDLDVPTIGCGKTRLIGDWNKDNLGNERGSIESLNLEKEQIGAVLRTQDNTKPVFVSIGHKISLETAISTTLKMCPDYRLPETTRLADQLVNSLMKTRKKESLLDNEGEKL